MPIIDLSNDLQAGKLILEAFAHSVVIQMPSTFWQFSSVKTAAYPMTTEFKFWAQKLARKKPSFCLHSPHEFAHEFA